MLSSAEPFFSPLFCYLCTRDNVYITTFHVHRRDLGISVANGMCWGRKWTNNYSMIARNWFRIMCGEVPRTTVLFSSIVIERKGWYKDVYLGPKGLANTHCRHYVYFSF